MYVSGSITRVPWVSNTIARGHLAEHRSRPCEFVHWSDGVFQTVYKFTPLTYDAGFAVPVLMS